TDGAAAIVLASPERARQFKREVVIRGKAQVNDFLPLSTRDFLSFEGPEKAIGQAMQNAGVTLDDINFAEVHDCFTIAELLIYEAMGLAPKGQGHRVLDDGTVMRGGKLPVNLSGGLKAKGHPVGATGVSMHAMSFRQLTGQAGEGQRKGANMGLVVDMGGAAVGSYASALGAKRAEVASGFMAAAPRLAEPRRAGAVHRHAPRGHVRAVRPARCGAGSIPAKRTRRSGRRPRRDLHAEPRRVPGTALCKLVDRRRGGASQLQAACKGSRLDRRERRSRIGDYRQGQSVRGG